MSKPLIFFNKSTDVVNNRITNRTIAGSYVFLYDTEVWKLVEENLTLSNTTNPTLSVDDNADVDIASAVPAGNNTIGRVNIRNAAGNANIDPLAETTFTNSMSVMLGAIQDLLTDIVLAEGTKIIGKMGIDQTTNGTTNKVSATQSTHDNLNGNMNLQIGNADNTVDNPGFMQLTGGSAVAGTFGIDQTTNGASNGFSGTSKNDGTDTAASKFHLTVGGNDGTNLRSLLIDNTGRLLSNLHVGNTPVSNSAPVPVNIMNNLINSSKVIEIQQHFAKNTAAGTEQTAIRIPKPTNPVLMYKVAITNSSIDSTLSAKLFNRRSFHLTGTAQTDGSPDNTHIVLAAVSNPTNDHYNGFNITITAGTGIGQTRLISDYVGSDTVRAEVSPAWSVIPDNTSVYSIEIIRDCLVWSGSFPKASLVAPIVKARDSEVITGLFDDGSDVYLVLSNDSLIANADASRFTAMFQLIPLS